MQFTIEEFADAIDLEIQPLNSHGVPIALTRFRQGFRWTSNDRLITLQSNAATGKLLLGVAQGPQIAVNANEAGVVQAVDFIKEWVLPV